MEKPSEDKKETVGNNKDGKSSEKTDSTRANVEEDTKTTAYRMPGEGNQLIGQVDKLTGFINAGDKLGIALDEISPDDPFNFNDEFWRRYQEITADMILGESLLNHPLIIGVDKSGRYGAIFMKHFLDKLSDLGYGNKPSVLFFAGHMTKHDGSKTIPSQEGDLEKIEVIKESVKNSWRPIDANDRVLITEDVVMSGSSLRLITRALDELGIGYDIAKETNQGAYNIGMKKYLEGFVVKPRQLFSGNDHTSDAVSRHRTGTGVYKKEGDLFSKRTVGSDREDRPTDSFISRADDQIIWKEIKQDRRIIICIAEKIAEYWAKYFEYLKTHPNNVQTDSQ